MNTQKSTTRTLARNLIVFPNMESLKGAKMTATVDMADNSRSIRVETVNYDGKKASVYVRPGAVSVFVGTKHIYVNFDNETAEVIEREVAE